MTNQINHGDIFDIGQTVNGVSTFVFLDLVFYYFIESTGSIGREYEYDQEDLKNLILNDEFDEVKRISEFC
jgi:hypothetical protein